VKAIVVSELGDPEVLRLREQPAPVPGPGQILVDISAAGVNFMDTGARRPGSAGPGIHEVPPRGADVAQDLAGSGHRRGLFPQPQHLGIA